MKQKKKKKKFSVAVVVLIVLDCIFSALAVVCLAFDGMYAVHVQNESAPKQFQSEVEPTPAIVANPDDWEIKSGNLYFYSDAGVAAWCETPEAKEKSKTCAVVIFSDSVTTIPDGMFEECTHLTSVVMGKKLKTIGASAFASCENLTDVHWSDALESIGDCAFMETGIVSLELPDSLKSIGIMGFVRCPKLETVILPDSLVYMDFNFERCTALRTLRLPQNIETIEDYSFDGCSALREVRIPASVKILGYDAFMDSGVIRMIFEGELDEIRSLRTSQMPALKEIVFMTYPPRVYGYENVTDSDVPEGLGLLNNGDYQNEENDWTPNVRVYCMSNYAQFFEQKDGMWNGFNFSVISSLDELPQITHE